MGILVHQLSRYTNHDPKKFGFESPKFVTLLDSLQTKYLRASDSMLSMKFTSTFILFFFLRCSVSFAALIDEDGNAYFPDFGIKSCETVLSNLTQKIELSVLIKANPPTKLNFKLLGLSDYGVDKQKKFELIRSEKRAGFTHLMTLEEREHARVYFYNGLFYNWQGNPIHSLHLTYVMDENGGIYAGTLHHPGYLAWGKVAAAGQLAIFKGTMILADRNSGQYAPEEEYLTQFKLRLEELGVDTQNIKFEFKIYGD